MNELEVFNEAKDRYLKTLNNLHYIFQMTKCCDHFEWFTVLKNSTCIDLYKYIQLYFETERPIKLFAKDTFGNKLEIVSSECTIRSLLLSNCSFFRPIYNLPHPVVYRLYVDDGHVCHSL